MHKPDSSSIPAQPLAEPDSSTLAKANQPQPSQATTKYFPGRNGTKNLRLSKGNKVLAYLSCSLCDLIL